VATVLKRISRPADVLTDMRIRSETILTLLIVLVVAVDAFVGLQVYQQRAEAPAPVALPLTSVPATTPATTPRSGTGSTSEDGAEPAAVVAAREVSTRYAVQNAVISTALAFVERGVMPTDSFAVQSLVPGASFVDGVGRADVAIIGVLRTDSTMLFVAAESEDRWICAAIDGNAQTTVYGRGQTKESIDEFSKCIGPNDGWAN